MNKLLRTFVVALIMLYVHPALPEEQTKETKPEIKVQGSRNEFEVKRVVLANMRAIKGCYREALEKENTLAGLIGVDFLVDPAGKIQSADLANVKYETLRKYDPKVTGAFEGCVVNNVKAMKFVKNSGGLTRVYYPFVFKVASRKIRMKVPGLDDALKKEGIKDIKWEGCVFKKADLEASSNDMKDLIFDIMISHKHLFDECYKGAIHLDNSVNGQARFKWKIDDQGAVLSPSIKKSGIKGRKDLMGIKYLEKCIVNKISDLSFPAASEKKVKVTLKMAFGN